MLRIKSAEVLADIRSAAWLESHLHPELDRNRRHEMADICENDNIGRVWRVLGIAVAEIRLALQKIGTPEKDISLENELNSPGSWLFSFRFPLPSSSLTYMKEKIHEYLVAAVMADRCAVIIPSSAKIWQERASGALACMQNLASISHPPLSGVVRPLWPL